MADDPSKVGESALGVRPPVHLVFPFRRKPPVRRRSRCLTYSKKPKRAYPSEQAAAAAAEAHEPRDGMLPEPYECPDHGWHLGSPRGPERPRSYRPDGFAARNVFRLEWLLGEVGDRAMAQMMSESHGLNARTRRRVIELRAARTARSPE